MHIVIFYKITNMKGLAAQAARTTEDGSDDIDVTSVNSVYQKGNLLVGAAHEEHGEMLSPVDTDNEDNARNRASGGAHREKVTPVAGENPLGIAVGIIHNF